jgi:hypothetical protein
MGRTGDGKGHGSLEINGLRTQGSYFSNILSGLC